MANNLFGNKDAADYLLHSYAIVHFGKQSLKELTEDEMSALIAWLDKQERKEDGEHA